MLIREHIEALNAAQADGSRFVQALKKIQEDEELTQRERTALYRLIGMECAVWYYEAVLGEPIDREKALKAVADIIEAHPEQSQATPGFIAEKLFDLPEGLRSKA